MALHLSRQLLGPFLGRLLPFSLLALLTLPHASAFDETRRRPPQLSTSQGPIKSARTISEAIQGSIDLLLTDMPMTDEELQHVHETRGVRLLHIATAVTAVVPCYNLAGLEQPLNFSSDTVAAIFLGKITKWNDPSIVALNPSSHLPATDIIVIGHAMEDGSTYAWTDFLSKTNTEWQRSVGRVRLLTARPAVVYGQTKEELAKLVRQTPNSISYTELWAAKDQNLQIGRVKNRSGQSIAPSPASVTAAARTAIPEIRADLRASITDTSGPHDYPIASFTWIVIPDVYQDSEKRSAVISFLKWILTDGQNSSESMHLGRMPPSIVEQEIRLIESVR